SILDLLSSILDSFAPFEPPPMGRKRAGQSRAVRHTVAGRFGRRLEQLATARPYRENKLKTGRWVGTLNSLLCGITLMVRPKHAELRVPRRHQDGPGPSLSGLFDCGQANEPCNRTNRRLSIPSPIPSRAAPVSTVRPRQTTSPSPATPVA